jgi:hypothetical protein
MRWLYKLEDEAKAEKRGLSGLPEAERMPIWSKNSSVLRYQYLNIQRTDHGAFVHCLKLGLQYFRLGSFFVFKLFLLLAATKRQEWVVFARLVVLYISPG